MKAKSKEVKKKTIYPSKLILKENYVLIGTFKQGKEYVHDVKNIETGEVRRGISSDKLNKWFG